MSFKDTQSYKELRSDWRWIHSMDPAAAAAADQWIAEHPEEWKELEHVLYYSEAKFNRLTDTTPLEESAIKQPVSYNPEAFLPEEVRNAIYDDMRWFDRAAYMPEGSEEDPLMYLRKELHDALLGLTELQREILFRTVINGESTESVARDKQCTSRNIRDIRNRALKHLRSEVTRREGSGYLNTTLIVLLIYVAILGVITFAGRYLVPLYPWLEYVGYGIWALAGVAFYFRFRDREAEGLLRSYWASLNGKRKEK